MLSLEEMNLKRIAAVVLLVFSVYAAAQNVQPSENGESHLYTVEAGEGLYSISRKFNVSQEEIMIANPQLKDGLRAGQSILIPQKGGSVKVEATEYVEHVVEKKQTLFAISRLYGVAQEEIIRLNPQAEKKLKAGETLKIPKKAETAASKTPETPKLPEISETAPALSENYLIHVVEPKETLYSICRMYAADMNRVVALNPGAEKKIRTGDKLKLPVKETSVVKLDTVAPPPVAPPAPGELADSSAVKIAFLLPFMLQNPQDETNEKFVEFYAGALLAVSEAKKMGKRFVIYTFDTEKSEAKVQEILEQPKLKEVDLIIGPAYSNQIQAVANFAATQKINTVIPFSANVNDIDRNPYLLQFNPNLDVEVDFTITLYKSKFAGRSIKLVYLKNVGVADSGHKFLEKLEVELIRNGIAFSKIEQASGNLQIPVVRGKENLLFFNTEKLPLVQPYFTMLDSLAQTAQIFLYKQYGWQIPTGRQFKVFSISPFVSLLQQAELSAYSENFKREMDWLPNVSSPQYDLLGYDLMSFCVLQLDKDKKMQTEGKTSFPHYRGIQSNLLFERNAENSGFINRQLYYSETDK
jgi:LysM repeat protein